MNQEQEKEKEKEKEQQYTQQISNMRYFKKKTTYVPTEDGFVTSAGNPVLAAKYGNNLGANIIKSQEIIKEIRPMRILNEHNNLGTTM